MFAKFMPLLIALLPLAAFANEADNNDHANRTEVTADTLKSWYDQNKPMVVLDARSKPYFEGTLLPNAKWVSAESSDQEIESAAPNKDGVVVVYCAGVDCPASGWLYDRMVKMGYKNVYEFHEGLKGWMKKGYPTTKK